jgi:hypothetical protein
MDTPSPPAWVVKRDGRLEPFDADKICRALFAVGESLGKPDAFLARELSDGVTHFLAEECDERLPPTTYIAEVVGKVVRELGQPALAEAFLRSRTSPTRVPARDTTEEGFTRDLLSARDDGLLVLPDGGPAQRLEGCVLARTFLPDALAQAARVAGSMVVIDGPEESLASQGEPRPDEVAAWTRTLREGLASAELTAVVNLNAADPGADTPAEGPLFSGRQKATPPVHRSRWAELLAGELLSPGAEPTSLRVDWHLGARDFEPPGRDRLLAILRPALAGAPVAFVFDRPGRPIALAEGVNREHPGVLMTVGVHLPRLGRLRGMNGDPERFLQRLGSLARLALSAGTQRRHFLRKQHRPDSQEMMRGFLLDRARLVVAPVGLSALVPAFTGRPMGDAGPGLDFARRVVQRFRDVLRQDGRALHLDTCVDGPASFGLGAAPGSAETVAGLTTWDPALPLLDQLRAAGALHAIAGHGTAALFLPEGQRPSPEELADWLHTAWRQTAVVRVRLVRR